MADISRIVRTAIYNRLSSATLGFNLNYQALLSNYGPNAPAFQIDWTERSQNFCYGMLPPDLAEQTSAFTYPLLTISADRGTIDPIASRIRFHQYSGNVVAMIQVVVSWQDSGLRDFETWPDCVIDAVYQTVNNTAAGSAWATGVTFNGEMNFTKGPILAAGQNWRRQILFPLSFRVLAA